MMGPMYNLKRKRWYEPDAHQIEAFDHLMANPRAYLALEMSLSKTVVALTYLHELVYRDVAATKVLIVAPDKVARLTWPDEIEEWAHLRDMRYSVVAGDEAKRRKALDADAELFLIGEANLRWLHDNYWHVRKKQWKCAPFDCIVIDEISLFKNSDSGRGKALAHMVHGMPYRVGLSGTMGDLVDLWAQIKLLDDGQRLGALKGAYIDQYFRIRGNGMIVYEYIPRPGVERILMGKLSDMLLTKRIKDTDIAMPPIEYNDLAVQLSPFDKEVYDLMERELIIELGDAEISAKTQADLSLKLLQLSSGAVYDEERNVVEFNTAKLDALEKLVSGQPGERWIIVYEFLHEVDRIKERLPQAHKLRSGAAVRKDAAAWNAGEIEILLLHSRSAGHGLNLQFGGRNLVWFSGTWVPELWAQTNARIYRRGVEWLVRIYRLICAGTRDRRQAQRVKTKQAYTEFMIEEVQLLRRKHGIEQG